MTIPVLWVSFHVEDGVKPRGDKADQALLESIFDRSLWRPPGALKFEHHEVRSVVTFTEACEKHDGAVVVIPSRDHIGDEVFIAAGLDQLDWSVVLLTSEEEWRFDWREVAAHCDRLWVWQGKPAHTEADAWFMPCGWYPGTREGLEVARANDGCPEDRPLDWFFAGQITHQRRKECFEGMRRLIKKGVRKGMLVETDHYLAGYADGDGLPHDEYLARMTDSKLVPCPSGPESLCTARVEEALEAGCVPLLDLVKPGYDDVDQFNYWELLFPEHPMPTLYEWGTLPEVVDRELERWPANANRCWAYWQQWKRAAVHRLDVDVLRAR